MKTKNYQLRAEYGFWGDVRDYAFYHIADTDEPLAIDSPTNVLVHAAFLRAKARAEQIAKSQKLPFVEYDQFAAEQMNCITVEWKYLKLFHLDDITRWMKIGDVVARLGAPNSLIYSGWAHVGGNEALDALFRRGGDRILGITVTRHKSRHVQSPYDK